MVTAAAVVGRLRPVHGELWLFEHGLLYRRLGARRTARQLRRAPGGRAPAQTVDPAERPRDRFSPADVERVAVEAPPNRWVARDDIRAARLRRRPTVARMRLDLAGGARLVVSWPRREQATPAVEAQLRTWLGDRLQSD